MLSDFAFGGEYRIGDMRMKRNSMYVLIGVIVCAAGAVSAKNAAPADENSMSRVTGRRKEL